jgi:probable F420-dependent oxidoreductase
MRTGFILPQIGPLGTADNLVKVAQRVEALGYDSVWVTERLLYPLHPQTPYPATPDGSLPEQYKHSLDPLETLTFVSAHTKRVALGTSVLDMPYYNPVMLARRITALDVFSSGRTKLGLGLGWSKDEYQAAGAVSKDRGSFADEFIQVLKAIWTTDPVEFQGKFFHVPKSIIQPKPVQKPHPPIYLAAYAPAALDRVAKVADGWNPAGVPLEGMAQVMGRIREMAKSAQRDPSSLQLIVRANLYISEEPIAENRFIFTGTLGQIKEDIEGCRRLKADEIFFDPIFSPDGNSLDRFLKRMEQLRELI